MDLIRFRALLDAYGAAPARWPDAERDAALALLRREPAAGGLLDGAGRIDDLLGQWRVPAPSPTLHAAVLARAHAAQPLRARWGMWWSALGLALVGAGGVLAGSAATAALLPVVPSHLPLPGQGEMTAFGDVADAEAG